MQACTCPGVVEAWTGGSSWEQVTEDCNLDDGDIARLLNRQASHIAHQDVASDACVLSIIVLWLRNSRVHCHAQLHCQSA